MRLKRQPRWSGGRAHAVIHRALGKRCANGDIAVVGEVGRVPSGEAVRVAEVSALIRCGGGGGKGAGVEVAEEVQFFAGVVFVDVDVVADQGVEGVFDGPEAGGRGVFDDALVVLVIASSFFWGGRGRGLSGSRTVDTYDVVAQTPT